MRCMSDQVTNEPATKRKPTSQWRFLGVLLAGAGLGGGLIAYPLGAGIPLFPAALGVGVILLTVDWLMRNA